MKLLFLLPQGRHADSFACNLRRLDSDEARYAGRVLMLLMLRRGIMREVKCSILCCISVIEGKGSINPVHHISSSGYKHIERSGSMSVKSGPLITSNSI
jgi:hypothetical protein